MLRGSSGHMSVPSFAVPADSQVTAVLTCSQGLLLILDLSWNFSWGCLFEHLQVANACGLSFLTVYLNFMYGGSGLQAQTIQTEDPGHIIFYILAMKHNSSEFFSQSY